MSGHGLDLPRERKLDLGIVELLDARAATLFRRHLFHLDDLNGRGSSPVPSTHVPVALSDSASGGVLAVHVVRAGAGVVAQPNAEVLHRRRLLLVHLLAVDDPAVSLLYLLQTVEVIPEARFRHDSIGGKDAHPEKRRHAQFLGRSLTSNNAVLD